MKTSLLIWLPVLLCSSRLWAQSANPTPADLPPGPPIQKRAPDSSQWLITSTSVSGTAAMEQQASLAARAPEGSSTIKVMVTKTGKIYRVEHLDEAKQLWTVWAAGATQIMVWADKHSAAAEEQPTHWGARLALPWALVSTQRHLPGCHPTTRPEVGNRRRRMP